jgi:hypothetical protein
MIFLYLIFLLVNLKWNDYFISFETVDKVYKNLIFLLKPCKCHTKISFNAFYTNSNFRICRVKICRVNENMFGTCGLNIFQLNDALPFTKSF